MIFPRNRVLLVLAALALLAGAALWIAIDRAGDRETPLPADRPALGLMTTLPIYWSETDSIGEMLDAEGETHWVRAALEQDYSLHPLDTLDLSGDLAGLD